VPIKCVCKAIQFFFLWVSDIDIFGKKYLLLMEPFGIGFLKLYFLTIQYDVEYARFLQDSDYFSFKQQIHKSKSYVPCRKPSSFWLK